MSKLYQKRGQKKHSESETKLEDSKSSRTSDKQGYKKSKSEDLARSSADEKGFILRFNPSKSSSPNLDQWLEQMESAMRKTHGEFARFFKDGAYFKFQIPNPPRVEMFRVEEEEEDDEQAEGAEAIIEDTDPFSAKNDPYGAAKMAYLEDVKFATQENNKMKMKRPIAFEEMWIKCSKESREAIKQVPEYDHDDRDPLALLNAIIKSHRGLDSVSTHKNKSAAEKAFLNLRMGRQETVAQFKERFDTALRNLEGVYGGELPKNFLDERIAIEFISMLDPSRFGRLQAEIENEVKEEPTTLAEAYSIAAKRKEAVVVEDRHVIIDASVFVAKGGKPGKGGKSESRRDEHDPDRKEKKPSEFFCEIHGHNTTHNTKDCFSIKKLIKERSKPNKSETANTTIAKKSSVEDEAGPMTMQIDKEQTFTTFAHIEKALNAGEIFLKDSDVLLDNQSTINIVRNPDLLRNIRQKKNLPTVSGIGGSVTPKMVGNSKYFGEVVFEPRAPANILSWALVSDSYDIEWSQADQTFTVQLPDKTMDFIRKGNLYVCDMSTTKSKAFVTTVSDNESKFTVREVQAAKRAAELKSRLGYASDKDMMWLLENGKIMNAPVDKADVVRRNTIYGPSLPNQKGAATEKTPRKGQFEITTLYREVQVGQVLSVDVMFVNKVPYLISVSKPLSFTMVDCLKHGRKSEQLMGALQRHIAIYRQHHFEVKGIITDRESAMFQTIPRLQMQGIQVNVSGSGQHAPVVENKIRRVKERVRAHVTTSPYKMYSLILMWLVYFCVTRINMMPCRTRVNEVSPFEAMTGRKLDFKRDLRVSFGEYAQSVIPDVEPKNDVTKQRTAACITLCPTGNLQGSVMMLHLKSLRVVARDHWTIMPMPDVVVNYLNHLHRSEKEVQPDNPVFSYREEEVEGDEVEEPTLDVQNTPTMQIYGREVPNQLNAVPEEPHADEPTIRLRSAAEVVEERIAEANEADIPDQNPSLEEEPNDEEQVPLELDGPEDVHDASEPPNDECPQPQPIAARTTRIGTGAITRKIYSKHHRPNNPQLSYNISPKAAIKKLGNKAIRSMVAEMLNLESNGSFTPVNPRKLNTKMCKKIIRSHMFLKEKFTSEGIFEKLKARLVARGDMEDRSLYDDPSSPTVNLESVFIIAALAAKERRHVKSVDITSAYLKAKMKNSTVYMRIDPLYASMLVSHNPEKYAEFQQPDGSLVVRLDKALYGCIESAKLWNECLTTALQSIGFTKNPLDPCVMNRVNNAGVQCTICMHVDDLLITSVDLEQVDEVIELLREHFQTLTVHEGLKHSYLGMTFNFEKPGEVKVTMEKYIEDLINSTGVKGKAATPATENLFNVQESPFLDPDNQKEFHHLVARLLYLAKRVRPEILPAIIFLASRVQAPTVEDRSKLDRVLKYLNGNPNLGFILKPNEVLEVLSYIDASFAVHLDYKSHTGMCISLGMGPVFVKSTKQKLMSKSSTESELIGLSDCVTQVVWTRQFLIHQGYELPPATVYQDNKSTISLVEKGRSTSERTRHINIRFFFVKDKIDSGDVKIEYLPTGEMIADILTKPLQGGLFRKLRRQLLNWDEEDGVC